MADEPFYTALLGADLTVLDSLADRWESIHKSIHGLGKRMYDDVLVPLRNKGYWRGRRPRTPGG